jgi:transcriptional regulator with XRE-family HTH domain
VNNRIIEIIKKSNKTQADIAVELDIAPQNFSRMLKNDDFKLSVLKKIAKALDISVYQLIGEDDKNKVKQYETPNNNTALKVAEPEEPYSTSPQEHCTFEPLCQLKKSQIFFNNTDYLVSELQELRSESKELRSEGRQLRQEINTMFALLVQSQMKLIHLLHYAKNHKEIQTDFNLKVVEKVINDINNVEQKFQLH